jgi:hypothetical protein
VDAASDGVAEHLKPKKTNIGPIRQFDRIGLIICQGKP